MVFTMNNKDSKDICADAHALLDSTSPLIMMIVHHIARVGGVAYLVGGAVRDLVLDLPVHDIDIEVHNLTLDALEKILCSYGHVNYEGKSFGVLRVNGVAAEWSLPRTDSEGRKPLVHIDPSIGVEHAARRRDLTMNALYLNLHTGQCVDPFGGIADMRAGILRTPDVVLFAQDPLRLFRVMQFTGRFGMQPNEELNAICATMDVSGVAPERIFLEYEKLLLQSLSPSLGFRWLQTIGRLAELLPELYATRGIPQRPDFHPEGDVFEHLMQTIDAAARCADVAPEDKLTLMYAALCHDLGKAVTTVIEDGVLRSKGHAQAGVPITRTLLKRMVGVREVVERVCVLVRYHMEPGYFTKNNAKPAAYRRLAHALAPHVTITLLTHLAQADRQGRNGVSHEPLTAPDHDINLFFERACEALVEIHPIEPLLYGRDIIDLVDPGIEMGNLLKWAYEQQIELGIENKDALKKMIVQKLRGTIP